MQQIHVYPDVTQLSRGVADAITRLAKKQGNRFSIALSGGSTPRYLFQTLADKPYHDDVPWQDFRWFFGDERTVPPDHADSNFRMANETLFSKISIPPAHIYRMQGEQEPATVAARDYAKLLDEHLPKNNVGVPQFDIVLLGLGPDGHIASLFPSTTILDEHTKWVDAVYVEKLKTWRLSITFPVINAAHHVFILVAGDGKADIVAQVLGREAHPDTYPVQMLKPKGELTWFLDEAAAQRIEV